MDPSGGDWSNFSETDLSRWALQGRSEAWDEIIRRHSRRVVVTLLAGGMRVDDAEDLTQEAWTLLIEKQRAGRLQELCLPGLVIAQARWLAKEASRTKARREAIVGSLVSLQTEPLAFEIEDPGPDPAALAAHRDRLIAIETELGRCSSRAQQIFRAVYGPEARSQVEVARDLGMSVQRVRQTLCEVRTRLRRALENLEKESLT